MTDAIIVAVGAANVTLLQQDAYYRDWVDLPKDVLVSETTWRWPERVDLPGYRPTTKGNQRQIVEAAKLIVRSKRPDITGVEYKIGAIDCVRRDGVPIGG